MIPDAAVTFFSLPVMYNGNECYFSNCCTETGRKLGKNQGVFLCDSVISWVSLGRDGEVFCFERAWLNECCTAILHLIFFTVLKHAVLRAWRIMKSNCLRFVSYVVQHSSLPSARTRIPCVWLSCRFLLWPSKRDLPCFALCWLGSWLAKGLSCIHLSCTRATALHETSQNLMIFRSLSNLIERELGV